MNLAENFNRESPLLELIGNMVFIPSGTFDMGSNDDEGNSRSSEKPQHRVSIDSFMMSKYPITQAQWEAIASLTDLKVVRDLELNPSRFMGDTKPVECVSWHDAVEFCARLSKWTRWEYRLPSEAEWEYACRAKTITPFCFGETLTPELANYAPHYHYDDDTKKRYPEGTTPVGAYLANDFGLCDMHGNIYEWCLDNWHDDYKGAPCDGSAWLNHEDSHVLRGGSWRNHQVICRSSARTWDRKRSKRSVFGFRIVCPNPEWY